MRVREHDRVRIHAFEFPQPIKAAVDHHTRTAMRNQQRSVHAMPARARVDLAARAEKRSVSFEAITPHSAKPCHVERSETSLVYFLL